MNTFTPQLSQQDLAEMIDREGLAFERRSEAITEWRPPMDLYQENKNASWYVGGGWEIRLAPGALTEFGLKPGMVPHNPDGLPADQITEGGKWRAAHGDEPFHHDGFQYWSNSSQEWTPIWYGGEEWYEDHKRKYTLRVPVGTPFSKPSRTEPPAEQSSATQQAGHDSDCQCGRCREDREDNPSQQAGQSLTPKCQRLSMPDTCFKSPIMTQHVDNQESVTTTWESPDMVVLDAYKDGSVVLLVEKGGLTDLIEVLDNNTYTEDMDLARNELTAALAQRDEANRLLREVMRVLQEIYDDTEGYADGSPDASAHDRLCNDISGKIRQPLTQITNHLKP